MPIEIGRRLRAVKIAPVGDGSAGAFQSEQHGDSEPFHASMQPNAASAVNAERRCHCQSPSFLLHDDDLARKFFLRQGLWTEGLRTPPGQECSNGSLTFFAVVLWRTFFAMKLLNVKTTRFAQIVEKSGRPEPYTLWQKPSADRHLQFQIKNNRVMTIQRSESGTEFGIVGFRQAQGARYLIFPKSLKRFENKRVVGINWDLLRAK